MDACVSFSSDGSNEDFSEFTPEFLNTNVCNNVTASNLYNDFGEHSCVPGVNGSTGGICVRGDAGSTFKNNDNNALRFDVTVHPGGGGIGRLSELRFYQLSPDNFEHLSGNSGNNSELRKWGLRVTVDGNEIFRLVDQDVNNVDWEQEIVALTGEGFEITSTTTFKFEILGYDPVGNSSQRFFDVDHIRVRGCCVGGTSLAIIPDASFLEFNATKSGRTVNLDWATNMDVTTETYIVERSTNGIDFEPMAERETLTAGSTAITYQEKDVEPYQGVNYYRLLQVLEDGTSNYSEVKMVVFDLDLENFQVYPNPTRNEINLSLKNYQGLPAEIMIANSLGQVMQLQSIESLTVDPVNIQVHDYRAGVYTVTVKVEGARQMTRLFVVSRL